MDGWLKALIGCACVVVIAAGGWYAWGEYSRHRIQTERSDRIESARRELFDLAQASDNDREKVVSFCNSIDNIIENVASSDTKAMWRQIKTNCRALGYL